MNPTGPYVAVASFCDIVLNEENPSRLSCIRFLDILEVNLLLAPDAPKDNPLPAITFPIRGLITFKSGGFKGKKTIRIDMVAPSSKKTKSPDTFPAVFEGDEKGVNLILDFKIATKEQGLYWFEVYLDDDLMTCIPLRLIINQTTNLATEGATNWMTIGAQADSGEQTQEQRQK